MESPGTNDGSKHAITRRGFVERALAIGAGVAWIPGVLGGCRPAFREGAGSARVSRAGAEFSLGNGTISGTWSVADSRLRALRVTDHVAGTAITPNEDAFQLLLADEPAVRASEMLVVGEPEVGRLEPAPDASRLAARLGGQQVTVRLADREGRVRVRWRGILRDGSRYLRQEITLESEAGEMPIREIRLVDLELPGGEVMGTVRGSPIVSGNWFLGFEHPLSESAVENTRATCVVPRELPLRPGTALVYSSVVGTTPDGQRRRTFLEYVERERAHPYRPFLHYNSWYDLGYFSKYDEAGALAVVTAYGTELTQRRGVRLDSFLFDDGWDDPQTLWHFHGGFPDGFATVRQAAARYGAAPGVWMSPWGGYGRPREERVGHGEAQGFETIEGRFALSGPNYYQRFRETCLTMIRRHGVNQFKFDGTGNAARVIPGSEFDSDFDAMIHLIGDLRAEKPDLYVNLTTGTYPSPFFLRHADSIWRGGRDHSFAGVGSKRQQWITYRDADTYRGIVQKGPLFPLNSLMLHGLIYATHARDLDTDPEGDFTDEIRSYFGSGTQLQEMYVTPALLTEPNWDSLAEAANWARRNARILVDTHWVGGNPSDLEVYGWASWVDGKGTLVLRNPKDEPQSFTVDAAAAFELPPGAPERYSMRSPWRDDRERPPLDLEAGRPHTLELAPFQVLTLESA